MSTPTKDYLSCAESAVMLRKALKAAFPAVKFSVRSKTYSGGASVDVSWINGPRTESVDRVAQRFSGASFDGMIDLKSYHDTVLCDEHGNTRSVQFGAHYIFCRREESKTLQAAIIAELGRTWNEAQWSTMPSYEHERMAWRATNLIEIPSNEPEAETVQRAVAAFFERGAS